MRTAQNHRNPLRHLVAAGLAATTLAAAVAGFGASPAGAGPRTSAVSRPAPVGFTLLAVNAGAAGQPTVTGRTITDLQFFEGRVHSGYGDYGANTGPVAVTSNDPTTGVATEHLIQDTEAVYNHRVLDGKLYTPSIDPRVGADYGVSGPWQEVDAVDAVHVFDMNTLGGDLWMVGSSGSQAAAWRSVDGGATWTQSLLVDAVGIGDFSRFYFAGVLGGNLYVQAYDGSTGAQPSSMVFDGSTWSAGPAVTSGWHTGWRPVEFGGQLVFHGAGHARSAPVFAFDGTSTTQVASGYDFDVAGGSLVILGADGSVRKTTNLRKWTNVAAAPAGSRSIAWDGVRVVVGTTASQLWVLQ